MKASEVIMKLTNMITEYGDLSVATYNNEDDCNDSTSEVSISPRIEGDDTKLGETYFLIS